MSETNSATVLATLAHSRRSIRRYEPEAIDPSEIREILSLAGRAPSAWNLQPWRFVVVTQPDTKQALQAAAFGQPQVGRAPAVVVLYSDMADALNRLDEILPPEAPADAQEKIRANILGFFGGLSPEQREGWARGQANIALGYLLLVLESRGYGSSPMLGFDPAQVKALLGLPAHVEIPALVAFGKPADAGHASHRLPVDALLRFA